VIFALRMKHNLVVKIYFTLCSVCINLRHEVSVNDVKRAAYWPKKLVKYVSVT
jgi:hypothetical protein